MSARTNQKKRASMRLVYIDFWSALKMSFLISLVLAVVTVVLTLLVLESIAGAQGAQLVAGLTFGNVMTFTLVVSLLEVIVVSALGAIFAALFNLATNVVGGWKVTFGSD